MIKIILLIFIVILCSAIGYLYGESFVKRYHELLEFKRVIIDMENEIMYTYTPLPECIFKASVKSKDSIKVILEEINGKLDGDSFMDVYTAFNESFIKYREDLTLKKQDIDIFLDMAKSLGETNIEGQSKIFNLAKEKLDIAIENADKECNRNKKMYRYLGVSLGLMIAIFLI